MQFHNRVKISKIGLTQSMNLSEIPRTNFQFKKMEIVICPHNKTNGLLTRCKCYDYKNIYWKPPEKTYSSYMRVNFCASNWIILRGSIIWPHPSLLNANSSLNNLKMNFKFKGNYSNRRVPSPANAVECVLLRRRHLHLQQSVASTQGSILHPYAFCFGINLSIHFVFNYWSKKKGFFFFFKFPFCALTVNRWT